MACAGLEKALDSPVAGQLACRPGAQKVRRGGDADPAQVQSIGVPAGADGRIIAVKLVRMAFAGAAEEVKSLVGQLEEDPPELRGKLGAAGSVTGIAIVVLPAAVMEDGKQPDHGGVGGGLRGKPQAVPLHPTPVGRTVNRSRPAGELGEDVLPEPLVVDGHGRAFFSTGILI